MFCPHLVWTECMSVRGGSWGQGRSGQDDVRFGRMLQRWETGSEIRICLLDWGEKWANGIEILAGHEKWLNIYSAVNICHFSHFPPRELCCSPLARLLCLLQFFKPCFGLWIFQQLTLHTVDNKLNPNLCTSFVYVFNNVNANTVWPSTQRKRGSL